MGAEGVPDIREMLSRVPGELRGRAEEAAASRRFVLISRKPLLLIYLGKSMDDYVVMPGLYCSCPAFTSRLRGGPPYGCHHVYGSVEAVERGKYYDLDGAVDPVQVVHEVASMGFSPSVRKAVFSGGGAG